MSTQKKVALVTQTRVKENNNQEFARWQESLSTVIAKYPGYISSTITPPNPPIQADWVIMQHFASSDDAKKWLQSQERQELLKQVHPILEGIDDVYLIEENAANQGTVSATISTIIRPQDETKFLEWNTRVAAAQSKFAGFLGRKIERPRPGIHDAWITIITFDSNEHLDEWLNSHEYKKIMEELNSFVVETHMRKVYAGFDFWFNSSGVTHTVWKENMLVLLVLYPMVFFLSYPQQAAMAHGMPFWLTLFFGNAVSVAVLGWFTVPWIMKAFAWWLNPEPQSANKYTLYGTLLVLFLYTLSLGVFWRLSQLA